MIDEYVRQLRHQLPGPGLARASMVREVRDGLDDAASAYVDDGLPRGAAERRAVEEFGPIGTLAAGLRDELTVAAGRSTATSAFVIGLVQLVGAQQLWKNEVTIAGWPSASETYLAWARAVDLFNLSAVALAGLALLVMTRGGRFVDPRPVVRALAIGVLTCIVIDIVAGVYLTAYAPTPISQWAEYQVVVGAALSLLPAVWLAFSARRSLVLSLGRPDAVRALPS